MTADRVYARNTCDWTLDRSFLVQSAETGTYTVRCPFYLVEHPEGTVVFDTGVSHELVADPAGYGPYGAPAIADLTEAVDLDAGRPVETHLDDLGYDPGDVDYVVLSHLHTDHAGNLDCFPGAEVVVGHEELRYAFYPDPVQRPLYLAGDFARLRTREFEVTPADGRYDLFGDGAVEVVPTPGHSPGHQSLKVELPDAGTVVLGADVAMLREGYEHGLVAPFAWSVDASARSLRRVRRLSREEDAEVYLHHDRNDQARIPEGGLA